MTNQTVTFKDKKYNIDDPKTAKNLTHMQEGEIERLNILLNDYKHLLEASEKAYKTCINTNNKLRANNKQFEKDIRESDRMLGECLDDKIAIEEEKEKIEESIKIFFRLNEKIIK